MKLHDTADRIQKQVHLNAPVPRVWKALTDHREFGEWFKVKIDAPFAPGEPSTGHITYPGYEHVKWDAIVQKMEPEKLFSLTWHPYAIDPECDYSGEPSTLVEFRLEGKDGGTFLTVTESGFAKLLAARRNDAFEADDEGWQTQMQNIKRYVEQG
jgi:uncharacterized protein YndB with AHSA1/START domain